MKGHNNTDIQTWKLKCILQIYFKSSSVKFFRKALDEGYPQTENRSKPVFRPKHPVPYMTLATMEKELNHLQQAGVIQSINYSL